MVNLKQQPFHLNETQIAFIENKIKKMSLEEKIGQLFFVIGQDDNRVDLDQFISKYKPGGVMFRPDSAERVKSQIKQMQAASEVPLFFAANLESGGNGIIHEGTWLGNPMQIAATDDSQSAYLLGEISGREAAAVGCNMSFAPIVDIDYNFRNPITNTRTFGSDVERVLSMSQAQMRGLVHEQIIPTIKHFPGDGVDERDQHLLSSINSLSAEDWMDSYGHIYKTLIDEGVPSVMIGHIYLPSWEQRLNPQIKSKEMRPASASSILIDGLLRQTLGFNGLAITDATAMVGYNVINSRSELLPATINAGVDMILFNKNIDEDYAYVAQSVAEGIISKERLDEAVTRILATKITNGIMDDNGQYLEKESVNNAIDYSRHQGVVKEIAKKSVTLVKDREKLLPLSPLKTPRIRLVVLGDTDDGGFKEGGKVTELFKAGLENRGFTVSLFQMDFHEVFEEGETDLKEKFDLAFYVANVETASNQTTTRLNWIQLMAANSPWFAASIPTLMVSTANPYHLFDVPFISTYINAYTGTPSTVDAVLTKLMGKESFEGINPIDPFCGDFVAKILD